MSQSPYSPLAKAGVLALAMIPLLAGCAAADSNDEGGTEETTPVRLALDWTSYVGYHSPLALADENGYFADEGRRARGGNRPGRYRLGRPVNGIRLDARRRAGQSSRHRAGEERDRTHSSPRHRPRFT